MGYFNDSTKFLGNILVGEKIVFVDSSLRQVMDYYLSTEQENILTLESALDDQNFSLLMEIGDKLYGHGTSFGFPFITQVGKKIEIAAMAKNSFALFSLINSLKIYLDNVSIHYV
jgi:HPt (histidine-containing phosphotransfer) domain-containing protein